MTETFVGKTSQSEESIFLMARTICLIYQEL